MAKSPVTGNRERYQRTENLNQDMPAHRFNSIRRGDGSRSPEAHRTAKNNASATYSREETDSGTMVVFPGGRRWYDSETYGDSLIEAGPTRGTIEGPLYVRPSQQGVADIEEAPARSRHLRTRNALQGAWTGGCKEHPVAFKARKHLPTTTDRDGHHRRFSDCVPKSRLWFKPFPGHLKRAPGDRPAWGYGSKSAADRVNKLHESNGGFTTPNHLRRWKKRYRGDEKEQDQTKSSDAANGTADDSWSIAVEPSSSGEKYFFQDKQPQTIISNATVNYLVGSSDSYQWNSKQGKRDNKPRMDRSPLRNAQNQNKPHGDAGKVFNAPMGRTSNDAGHVRVSLQGVVCYVALLALIVIGAIALTLYAMQVPPTASSLAAPLSLLLKRNTATVLLAASTAHSQKSISYPKKTTSTPTAVRASWTTRKVLDICWTAACQSEGAFLSHLLLRDTDPCDDFYRFVCGRWRSRYSEAEAQAPASSDDELVLRLETDIRELLRSAVPHNEHHLLTPLKDFFKSCTMLRDDDQNVDALLELLSTASLAGFPHMVPVRNAVSVWKIAAKVLLLSSASVLINVQISAHPFDAQRSILAIDLPESLLGHRVGAIKNGKIIQAYHTIVWSCFNVTKKQLVPSSYVTHVVDFALQIESLAAGQDVNRHRIVLLKEFPGIAVFVREVLSQGLDGSTQILLRAPEYVVGLDMLIEQTSSHVVMDFLGVHVLARLPHLVPALGEDLAMVSTSSLFGRPQKVPRWRTCLRLADRAMPYLLLHVSRAVGTISRAPAAATKVLLDAIRKGVVGNLNKLRFMDNLTRILARRILSETRFQLFGPPWISDQKELASYLSNLPDMRTAHPLWSFSAAHTASLSSRLRLPYSEAWSGSAFDTRCWHDLQRKTIFVPMLALDFSSPVVEHMHSLQLARGGVRIVSCVLQMLIEGVSSHYSHETVIRSWWTNEAKNSFRESLACLQGTNSVTTATSLLEDELTLRLVLDIYQSLALKRPEARRDIRLPGVVDFTAQHLFIIYMVLSDCYAPSKREKGMAEILGDALDIHDVPTTASQRLNVTLLSIVSFRNAFECKPNPDRNLLEKCSAWSNRR